MPEDLSDHKYLLKCVNEDLNDMIETYLIEMNAVTGNIKNDAHNLLNVLGAIQACLQDIYKRGLGEKETSMLYYGIADRIIAEIVNREIDKSAKS